MKKRLLSLFLTAVMLVSLIPATVFAAETAVTVTVAGTEQYSYAAEVFTLLNEQRSSNGLSSLTRNATLSELAMQRAAEIALYYESNHLRPDNSECSTIADGVYTGWTTYGENIAIGQLDPEEAMEDWMDSQGHRENILNEDYTQVGVGCFYADGVYCWVQIFGNSTSDTAATTATGSVATTRTVEILPSNLDLSPTGEMELELEEGESHSLTITTTNPGFPYISPALVSEDRIVSTADGVRIASGKAESDGTYTITAENPGSAAMDLTVYSGQSDYLRIYITVPGEAETEPPATTEPAPTETTPTEPPASDPTILAQGQGGEQVFWTLTQDGTLTVSGVGEMYSDVSDAPWYAYRDQIIRAVVEDGVTSICDYAFFCYGSITSLEMADSVTSLGYRVCDGASNLSHVKLSNGLTEIPFSAFDSTALTEIVVPDGVTYIDKYAFSHCGKLTTAVLPDSVTGMGGYVFWYCENLSTVNIPAGLTEIPSCTFEGTAITELVIPGSVTSIENYAFADCPHLEALLIPDSVTSIGYNTFDGSSNLTICTYQLSYSHLYAESYGIPYVILDEDPNTPVYPISVYTNSCGTAVTIPEASPANRYVLLQLEPNSGCSIDQIFYYYASEVELDLQFSQISDTEVAFFMPACEVAFDIYFIMDSCPFADVKTTDYCYEPVLWAVSNEITTGLSAAKFGPNNYCTRAQVVTFLWRTAGCPEPTSAKNPFTDVYPSDYYYQAVLWAVEEGITTGLSATKFGPDNYCTRAQVATFLWRYCDSPKPAYGYNPFSDVKSSEYYYDAVLWAVEYGITTGVDSTHFAPSDTCTRGQIVTFLYRTFHG